MRAFFLISALFFTYCSLCQKSNIKSLTLDEAIESALLNNPCAKNDSSKKNIVFEIKRNWYNWLFSINTYQVLIDFNLSLSDLERITSLRYETGDIEYYESASRMIHFGEIKTISEVFANRSRQYQNSIRKLLYSREEVHPADSAIGLYELNKSTALNTNWFRDDNDYNRFYHEIEIENRQIDLDNHYIKLRYFKSFALKYANDLISNAVVRLKSEDIDYIEYADSIMEAFKIRLEYLEVLNLYNQCAIQLEYYAY